MYISTPQVSHQETSNNVRVRVSRGIRAVGERVPLLQIVHSPVEALHWQEEESVLQVFQYVDSKHPEEKSHCLLQTVDVQAVSWDTACKAVEVIFRCKIKVLLALRSPSRRYFLITLITLISTSNSNNNNCTNQLRNSVNSSWSSLKLRKLKNTKHYLNYQ